MPILQHPLLYCKGFLRKFAALYKKFTNNSKTPEMSGPKMVFSFCGLIFFHNLDDKQNARKSRSRGDRPQRRGTRFAEKVLQGDKQKAYLFNLLRSLYSAHKVERHKNNEKQRNKIYENLSTYGGELIGFKIRAIK